MASITRTFAQIVALSLSLAVCAGCKSDNENSNAGVKGLSQADADKMNSSRSSFDQPGDPPFNVETRFAAGQLAESQNNPGAAIEQYKEALKIDPKHQPSMFRLAVVYTQAKAYPQAIEAWKKYIAATNNSARGYSNLGFCYELAGKNAEAEAAYKMGLARDPKCEPCCINYGMMLVRTGRVEDGRNLLQTVLEPAQAAYNIGSVLEQTGRKDQAREEYNKALKLDPNFQQAQARLSAMN